MASRGVYVASCTTSTKSMSNSETAPQEEQLPLYKQDVHRRLQREECQPPQLAPGTATKQQNGNRQWQSLGPQPNSANVNRRCYCLIMHKVRFEALLLEPFARLPELTT